ncbi:17329_t:CDS:2, partial [Acaulospora colombiana]
GGPATVLADFAKEIKERKLRAHSSYRTLKDFKEILAKYGIVSGDITRIPQFTPVTHKIDDDNPAFKFCVEDILRRIKNMGTVVDTNEAMRCEYISTILHASVSLLEDLVISPQADIVGEENTGRVDYAIKKVINEMLEEIICITEGKQNQATMGICQNLMQCRSACDMNLDMIKRKRKADEAFEADYEYVYGIV